jgi:hypothetical protein
VESQVDFLEFAAVPALKPPVSFGIPACVAIVQAALESRWGKPRPFIPHRNPHSPSLSAFENVECAYLEASRRWFWNRNPANTARLERAYRAFNRLRMEEHW